MPIDLLERRAASDLAVSGRQIVGHALIFHELSGDLGGFVEVIEPAAVDRTLHERLDVRALVNHDPSQVIGRTKSGTLTLTKDARGLRVAIDPPNTSVGRDIVESVRRGDVSGMSFAFSVVRPGGERFERRGEARVRILSDIVISDVSIVTFPAYSGASVDVTVAQRSLQAWQQQHVAARAATSSSIAWLRMRDAR